MKKISRQFVAGFLLFSTTLLNTSPEMKKPNQNKLMEMASAFIVSRAIHTAAELKIADHLVNGPQSIQTLAQKTHLNEDALYRLMRFLASYDIFHQDEKNNFALTPLAQQMVSSDPESLWAWVTYHNDDNRWRAYQDMKYSIETGKPAFNTIFGQGYFDFLTQNPLLSEQFDEGMKNLSHHENAAMCNAYNFSRYNHITDIGGGKGGLIAEIMSRNNFSTPAKGTLFDLPYVEKAATEYLASVDLGSRVTFAPSHGFFEIPHNADLYILKRILHDWNDQDCITILNNCHNAMNMPNTRLLIIENIVSDHNSRDFSKDIDIAMMILFGGKERTKTEWETLLTQACLEITNVYTTESMLSIIEVQKIKGLRE